jgi:hypothetical protein
LPINLPDTEKEPAQARAAGLFIGSLKGVVCVCSSENWEIISQDPVSVLAFDSIESARAAKWRFEEYNATGLEIMEGRLSRDGKRVDLHRVIKGG